MAAKYKDPHNYHVLLVDLSEWVGGHMLDDATLIGFPVLSYLAHTISHHEISVKLTLGCHRSC